MERIEPVAHLASLVKNDAWTCGTVMVCTHGQSAAVDLRMRESPMAARYEKWRRFGPVRPEEALTSLMQVQLLLAL